MQRFSTSLATVSRLLVLALLSCVMMGEVQAQTVCSAVYQDGGGTLQLCNNLILNNVSDIATNVYTIPSSNIIGDNTDIFTDNHLDFSIKPGSVAENGGDGSCALWLRDMRDEERVQSSNIDVGAFEVFIIHENESYAVYQDRTGTLQLCNNLILNNGTSWVTNVSPVLSNNIVGENSTIFVDRLSDFSIREGSAAMNAGDNDCVSWEQDITGGARIECSIVDAGAYEVRNIVPDMTFIDETICEGAVYDFHGNGLSEEGDYTHTLTNAMGCDSIVTLHLMVNQGTHHVTNTAVCGSYTWTAGTGDTYTESGTYTFRYTNADGCPSADTLHLSMMDPIAVTVAATTDTVCSGDSVTLYADAIAPSMVDSHVPPVAVGDILCTDNSIVKPSEWPVPGKTAMGIVCYVDNSDEHGWAIHLHDYGTRVAWSTTSTDISVLANFATGATAITDLDGYTNTQRIRSSGNASTYPAAYAVGFAQGWYLPASAQMRCVYSKIPILNASLQMVGGTPFSMTAIWGYWSSTEADSSRAWHLDENGQITSYDKTTNYLVRSARNF